MFVVYQLVGQIDENSIFGRKHFQKAIFGYGLAKCLTENNILDLQIR